MKMTTIFTKVQLTAISLVFVGAIVAAIPLPAAAATCPAGQQQVSIPVSGGTTCVPINSRTTNITQNPIFVYLRAFLIFLGGGVGLAVVGGIVAGAYMYITARGNAGQAQQGQNIIINAVIGLLLFIFMYAILQFLIPGGIFS